MPTDAPDPESQPPDQAASQQETNAEPTGTESEQAPTEKPKPAAKVPAWRKRLQAFIALPYVRPSLKVLAVLAFGYAAVCVVAYIGQRALLYHPTRRAGAGSEMMRLKTLAGYAIVSTHTREGAAGAVIYFGGNAEDVSYAVSDFATAFPEHAVYAPHYRGYGGSDGDPEENGIYLDALLLLEKVRGDHPEITLVGRSLGSALAVRVAAAAAAASKPVKRIVLVTPFDSIAAVGKRKAPWLPVDWILKDRWDAAAAAQSLASTPVLMLAAEKDELIPRENTEALKASFKPGLVTYTVIPAADHNSISDNKDYMRLIAADDAPAAAP